MLPQNFYNIVKIFTLKQLYCQYEIIITTIKSIIITIITKIAKIISSSATTTKRTTIATKCFIMFFLMYILMLQKPIHVHVCAGSCREAQLCCSGRDSSCVVQKAPYNAIIEDLNDKPCYCDHACLKLGDCCMDFKDHCGVLDCQVSDWGQWSGCDVACGMGIMVRTRYIIQAPQNGGKHCLTLMQKRGCQGFRCHDQRKRKILRETALLLPAALSSSKHHLNGSQDDMQRYQDTYKHNRELEYCVEFEVLKSSKACHKLPSYNLLIEGDRITVRCDLEAFIYENDNYNNKNKNTKSNNNKQSSNAINNNKIEMQGNSQLNPNELSNNYSLQNNNNNKNIYNKNNSNDNKWTENNDNTNDNEDNNNNNNNNNNDNNGDDNENDHEEGRAENLNDEHQNDNYNYIDNDNDNDNDNDDDNDDDIYHYYGMKYMKYYNKQNYATTAKHSRMRRTTTKATTSSTTTTTNTSTPPPSSSQEQVLMQTLTPEYHCRGEGLSGRTTRWSALAAPSCHGKWLRLTVGVPKPCLKEQFIFV